MLSSKRAANQKPEEMLNHGWWRFTDPSTQFQYFWNEATNESQYERPDEFSTVKDDIFASSRAKSNLPADKQNEGWARYTDEETKMHYFYKATTDEGQWERPLIFETVKGGGVANASVRNVAAANSAASFARRRLYGRPAHGSEERAATPSRGRRQLGQVRRSGLGLRVLLQRG